MLLAAPWLEFERVNVNGGEKGYRRIMGYADSYVYGQGWRWENQFGGGYGDEAG